MRYTINWRFLLKLVIAVVIVAIPVHFLHSYQVRKQVDVFLHHADEAHAAAEADDKLAAVERNREITFLRRYLMARPDDIDIRERLARSLCENAKEKNSPRELMEGYLTVEEVLTRDKNRDDLREFVIEPALALGLYAEARGHIDELLKTHPNDGKLEGLRARSLAAQRKLGRNANDSEGAWYWYERSISHKTDLLESYAELAAILRLHMDRPLDADAVMARMLGTDAKDPKKTDPKAEENLKNFRTFLYIAGYWRGLNRGTEDAMIVARPLAEAQKIKPGATVNDAIEEADKKAQTLAPDELDVILLAADVARQRARHSAFDRKPKESEQAFAEARRHLSRGLELHPDEPKVYLATASLDAETKSPAEAIATIRKGREAIPNAPELTLALLDYQIRAGEAKAAEQTLKDVDGLPKTLLDYQQARIHAVRQEWLDAAPLLESVLKETANNPGLGREVRLLLGRCYAQLGENDRSLQAFEGAVPDNTSDPLWIPAMLRKADAQLMLGRSDDALDTYRRLKDVAPGTWVQILRLEVLHAMRSAEKDRDWKPAEEALAAAERHFQGLPEEKVPTEFLVLRADFLSFTNEKEKARKQLEELRKDRPKDLAVWIAIAAQQARGDNPNAAESTLAAAEKELGDSSTLRLARARLWIDTKETDLATKLEGLAGGADTFAPSDQRRLLRELAGMAGAAGSPDVAGRLWEKLAAVEPNDLGVQLRLFDRALQVGDRDRADRIRRTELTRIDGENGDFTRFAQAILWLRDAQKNNDRSHLDDAQRLLEALVASRPQLGRAELALSLLYDLRGDIDSALEKYREALAHGETSPDALRRYMELLTVKGRFAEANEALKKLRDSAVLNEVGQRVAAEVQFRAGDLNAAVESAIKAVPADSKNPKDQLWLGQMLWAARDNSRAEAALRKAAELDPASTDGWLTLIRFLLATDRKDDALKVLESAKDKVEKIEQSLFLAFAYSQVGDREKTEAAFKKASAERPDHVPTAMAEAQFLFQSGQLPEARQAFEKVANLPSATQQDREAARQMIAFALSLDRDYETSRKALQALDQARPGSGTETPSQRRTRALLLATQRDRESKLQAIRLLEENRSSSTANDQFLMARLHLAVGNRPQFRVVMTDLLRKPEAARIPLYISFYTAWLLEEGDTAEAAKWLQQLKSVQPDSLPTAILESRFLAIRRDLPKARAILLKQSESAKAPVATIARVCEEVGLFDDAERLFKRFVIESQADRPEAALALAAYYGRRGRLAEALKICESMPPTVPTEVTGDVALNALYLAPSPSKSEITQVATWLENAAGKAEGQSRAVLLQKLATVRNLQGDYAASISQYRRAIAANPRDALALNNLAFLISVLENKHDEALMLIAQAKRVIGPNPDLLDTEAMIRFNKGEFDAARKLLQEVIAVAPSGEAYFHLAQVEFAAGRRIESRVAWKRSIEDHKLKPADLHPLEREAFRELEEKLNQS